MLRSILKIRCIYEFRPYTYSQSYQTLAATELRRMHQSQQKLQGLLNAKEGNLTAATDVNNLETKKINHILTIDSCPLPRKITELKNIKLMFVQVTDIPKADLLSHFEDTYKFIESGVKDGVVLVHCYAGISRSATVVLAYLMKKYGLSLDQALELSKSKRRFIGPNPGFVSQLQLYETMGSTIDPENIQYRMFRLYITANQVKQVKILPQGCASVVKPDPALVRARPDPLSFRCRKCRRIVALASNILPHVANQKYNWNSQEWASLSEKETCSLTYFIEPLAWMVNATVATEGRLQCPQCQSKLGSFSWIMGCQCPCGARVSPAFYLVPSKVDKSNFVQNMQVTV